MGIKLLPTSALVQQQMDRENFGSQARQESDLEGRESLKADIRGTGTLVKAISVRKWCRYSGIAAAEFRTAAEAEGLTGRAARDRALDLMEQASHAPEWTDRFIVVDGHTRVSILEELAQEGVEELTFHTGSMEVSFATTSIYAEVLPSFTELAEDMSDDEPGTPDFLLAVNTLLSKQLQTQESANIGVTWQDASRSVNFWQMLQLGIQKGLMPSDPFGIAEPGISDEKLRKLAEKSALDEIVQQSGKDRKEILELIKLSDPTVTKPELYEAYKEGLILKTHLTELRQLWLAPVVDEESGEVTNQEQVDSVEALRAGLLKRCLEGELSPTQLRKKISSIQAGGTKIKEKGRASKPTAQRIPSLSEETATAWVQLLDGAAESASETNQAVIAGAIAAIKAAADAATQNANGVLGFILLEAEEYLEDLDEAIEAKQG